MHNDQICLVIEYGYAICILNIQAAISIYYEVYNINYFILFKKSKFNEC